MKILPSVRSIAVALLTLGIAAGCATAEKAEKPAPVAQQTAADRAIAEARAALEQAQSLGAAWRDTESMIKEAEKLAKEGKEQEAIQLANEARQQAELAIKQYHEEKAVDRSLETPKQTGSYTVTQGDSLWGISGMPAIYGNPYQWPLIYKANSSKIKDADLIYPGQELDINRAPSASEVDAAVRHAKTRGAWSLGAVEESDQVYLGR